MENVAQKQQHMGKKGLLLAVLSCVGFVSLSHAAVITSPGSPSLIRSTKSANDVGQTVGDRIIIIDDGVTPNSASGTTVTATTTNLSSGLPRTLTLNNQPTSTVFPNQYARSITYDPNLTAPWTLTVANGSNSATVTTPSLVGVNTIPFASSVTISGSSNNPTFSWQYPANSVDGVIINIFNRSQPLPGGGFNVVYATTLPGTANSFIVPTVLAGGQTLQLGTPYAIDIYGVQSRNSSLAISNHNSAAWSEAFFDFTRLPTGSPLVNLPLLTPSGSYQYTMSVVAGLEVFIDPTIAVGYDYQIGAGDPNFASVQLPSIQAGTFSLAYNVGGSLLSTMVAPGGTFTFPTGGVSEFEVTGIDPSLLLDPNNTTAFVTGLTFTADGLFTGTQTPITINVAAPEPASFTVLTSSVLGVVLARCRRRSRSA